MLAIRNPYSVYRGFAMVGGVVAWFFALGVTFVAFVLAWVFCGAAATEIEGESGLWILLVIVSIIGFFVLLFSIEFSFEEGEPAVIPVVAAGIVLIMWAMCGLNVLVYTERAITKNDEVRILRDGTVVRFGDAPVPRGYFVPHSVPLRLGLEAEDSHEDIAGANKSKESVSLLISLDDEHLDGLLRTMLANDAGKLAAVASEVHAAAQEEAKAALEQARKDSTIVTSMALHTRVPWIKSILVTKVVRESVNVQ